MHPPRWVGATRAGVSAGLCCNREVRAQKIDVRFPWRRVVGLSRAPLVGWACYVKRLKTSDLPRAGIWECTMVILMSWSGIRRHGIRVYGLRSAVDGGIRIRVLSTDQGLSGLVNVLEPFHTEGREYATCYLRMPCVSRYRCTRLCLGSLKRLLCYTPSDAPPHHSSR